MTLFSRCSQFFLAAAIAIPLQATDGREKLEYKKIPSHNVEWLKDSMTINVAQSDFGWRSMAMISSNPIS